MKMKAFMAVISIIMLITACDKKDQDDFVVDPKIQSNPVYKKLNKERDAKERFILDAVPSLKTSDVFYVNDRDSITADSSSARNFNCVVYLKADTLQIDIGRGTGYGGRGFVAACNNKQFTITPYYSTNVIKPYEPTSTFNVLQKYMALNKEKYNAGDSIFGKVKFKIIEQDGEKKITHTAEGYFRSKVVGL
nr:hypothetical protein [uncultured Mucilaginibacter sp.]